MPKGGVAGWAPHVKCVLSHRWDESTLYVTTRARLIVDERPPPFTIFFKMRIPEIGDIFTNIINNNNHG